MSSNNLFMIIFQAAQTLESRINKMTGIYTLGVETLKDLANTLHMKASSDMEQIQSKVSSQTLAAKNVTSQEILVVTFSVSSVMKALAKYNLFYATI